MVGLVAIALVVDSSLSVLAEWQRLLVDCFSFLLQRLHELHAGRQFRIGLVCYAPSATKPSPVLCRNYFGPPTVMIKEIREESGKFGIGQTGSGGKRGMAVLDGLVAAIELFDKLKETESNIISHIIHVAAVAPDSAERPMWNFSPQLDEVTWKTLPGELRKRDINYSCIQLKPIPELNEIFNIVSVEPAPSPWFTTRPHHIVRLMGYPAVQKGVKRTAEPASSPEHKKARTAGQVTQPSPRSVNHSIPTTPGHTPSVLTTPTMTRPTVTAKSSPPAPQLGAPAVQSAPHPQPAPSTIQTTASVAPVQPTTTPVNSVTQSLPQSQAPILPNQAMQALLAKVRQGEANIERKIAEMKLHEAAGRTKEASELKAQVEQALPSLNKLKMFLHQQYKRATAATQLAQAQAQQNNSNLAQPAQLNSASQQPIALSTSTAPAPTVSQKAPEPIEAPPVSSINTSASTQLRVTTQASPVIGTIQSSPAATGSNVSPQIQAQMQKLVEQQQRSQPPRLNPPGVGNHSEQGTSVPKPPQGQPPGGWRGTLTWRGFDANTNVRRDMSTQVAMQFSPNGDQVRTDGWPTSLALSPSPHRAVPWLVLQDWIKRHKCAVFSINPFAQSGDAKINEENSKALIRLLEEKKIYALAAWTNPSGVLENRLLIFQPQPSSNLLGAYFSQPGGVPELPKTNIGGIELDQIPAPIALLLSRLSPEQQNNLTNQPMEKRMQWLRAMWTRHQQIAMAQQGKSPQGQPQQPQVPQMSPGMNMGIAGQPVNGGMQGLGRGGVLNQFLGGQHTMQQANMSALLNSFANAAPPIQQLQPQAHSGAAMMNYNLGMPGQSISPPGLGLSMHQRTGSGSAPGGLSMETFQSFMQRNQGGNPGMG